MASRRTITASPTSTPRRTSRRDYSASYYAWDARPGMRFISLDTVSDGGVVEQSSNGNIDDPQWLWLERELDRAEARGQVVVVYGHHPIRSLTSMVADELAAPCTAARRARARREPGLRPRPAPLDTDPRRARPRRRSCRPHPNVVAYVAGHTHENKVLACGSPGGCPAGGNWWEVEHLGGGRLAAGEPADRGDGQRRRHAVDLRDARRARGAVRAAGRRAPTPGASRGAQLAALGRAFSFNDPQSSDGAAGAPGDQNVELIVRDPRP